MKPLFSEKAAHFYEAGRSLKSISRTLDIPYSTVRKTLVKRGVAMRSPSQRNHSFWRGAPPYGFVVVDGRLVEDIREQRICQLILEHWQLGKSHHAIAQLLNRKKVKPRRGSAWQYATIRCIVKRLQNTRL